MVAKKEKTKLELLEAELSELPLPPAPPKTPPKPLQRSGFLSESLRSIPFGDTNVFDVTLSIMDGILDSLPFETACMQAGATVEDVRALMNQHKSVGRALNYAYAQNALKWIKKLEASGDWKATAYYLEHGVPTIFGETKSIVAIRGETQAPPSFSGKKLQDLTDDELLALAGAK